jgi:hypothetical protein
MLPWTVLPLGIAGDIMPPRRTDVGYKEEPMAGVTTFAILGAT